jgi:CheY-like chemotaxis protein
MIRLLIVDDNAQNLYLLRFLLEGHGYEVTSAVNGLEALEKARHDQPDIIIADILMPVMDGFTLCRQWKRDEGLKEIPFIFYTATYTEPSDEKLALSLGAERFIVKPVKPEELVEMLREVIEGHKEGRMVSRQPAAEEEEANLEAYNQILIRKLEDKLVQLEETNRELERESIERKQAEEALAYRFQVEKLANEISVSFVSAEITEIDEIVTAAIESIARFSGANRSSLFLLSDDLETITNTHEWCTSPEDSQIALLQDIPFSTFGYHRKELLQHRTISISRLEDFPPTAKGEREWIEEHGFRSLLFVPFLKQGKLYGALGFYGGIGDEVTWPSEFVEMLRITGNLILSLLERKQAEQEKAVALALQRLRNEILRMEREDDSEKVVSCLHNELSALVAFNKCNINLVDRPNKTFHNHRIGSEGTYSDQVFVLAPALEQAMTSGAPVYRPNRAVIEQFRDNANPGTHSIVDVPFLRGTIAINSEEEDAFDEADIHILSQFAREMSESFRRLGDMAERKQMEQELIHLERLRAVGELSAGISHNLNNILTNVLGPAQLIKRKTNDPELLREVDDIVTSAGRARDLVHELHLSVRTDGAESLHSVSVDQVVQQAVQTSRPRWKDEPEAQGATIKMVTEWGGVPSIQGSGAGLHDILTNFIFNAVDAMPEGGTITIVTRRIENQVQITFSDTGTGMSEETRRRIFEPFFTTKLDIGTGLGLSTVYNTVTRWGGAIEVDSTLGKGTTFTLRLPVWIGEKVEEEEKRVSLSIRSGKVLVIDDDEAVCSLLSRLLEEHHEVEAVTDGRKILAQFVPGKYDVALIDLGMSGISGDQLLKQIKEIDPQVATVLITGWTLPETDTRVVSFDFQIQKPFDDLDDVEDVVAQAIALHDERVGMGS